MNRGKWTAFFFYKESKMKNRYFLKTFFSSQETEVTKEQYIQAERNAGFYPKSGNSPATASFSSGTISGRVQYSN